MGVLDANIQKLTLKTTENKINDNNNNNPPPVVDCRLGCDMASKMVWIKFYLCMILLCVWAYSAHIKKPFQIWMIFYTPYCIWCYSPMIW